MDKFKQRRMVEEQKQKHEENMKLPINQFLNAKNEDGSDKYPVAAKLRKYFINNPDPILNDMRMANALLHELRWRKSQAIKHLYSYNLPEGTEIELKNKNGELMTKGDCYLTYIAETQSIHMVLSKLREHLSSALIAKIDGTFFTFEMANDFVSKIDAKVKELGYTLLPDSVELIEPL